MNCHETLIHEWWWLLVRLDWNRVVSHLSPQNYNFQSLLAIWDFLEVPKMHHLVQKSLTQMSTKLKCWLSWKNAFVVYNRIWLYPKEISSILWWKFVKPISVRGGNPRKKYNMKHSLVFQNVNPLNWLPSREKENYLCLEFE